MLKDDLEDVEKCGFGRGDFPFEHNNHRLYILHNDAYADEEERLYVHITLYCSGCEREETIRGRSAAEQSWMPEHLQDIKTALLGRFEKQECS